MKILDLPAPLNHIIRLGKDTLKKFENTEIVYKFSCKKCPAIYIGQCKRELNERIEDHKKANLNSVVGIHQNIPEHHFDYDNTQILDREPSYYKRLLSEMIHINSNKNTLNKIDDLKTLNNIYKVFLNRISE